MSLGCQANNLPNGRYSNIMLCLPFEREKPMNKKYDYDEKTLKEICQNSFSYAQCLNKMGLKLAGGNYSTLRKNIKKFNIDVSHFRLQGWNRGKTIGPKRPIEDYLSNKYSISSNTLKKKLISIGFFDHKCYECNNTEWNNQPIPIELHHIDGNNKNNNLSNLTILCPNCHAQTDNYAGRKNKTGKPRQKYTPLISCLECGQSTQNPKYCSYDCARLAYRKVKQRPTPEELQELLKTHSLVKIGKMFEVSDNAVRKWLKKSL